MKGYPKSRSLSSRSRVSKYEPHQSARECARRVRQIARGQISLVQLRVSA